MPPTPMLANDPNIHELPEHSLQGTTVSLLKSAGNPVVFTPHMDRISRSHRRLVRRRRTVRCVSPCLQRHSDSVPLRLGFDASAEAVELLAFMRRGACVSTSIPADRVAEAARKRRLKLFWEREYLAVAPACPCGRPALFVALVHRVSGCSRMDLDLTPDGAEIHVLCAGCLRETADNIKVYLRAQYRHIPQGLAMSCYTCGRPLTELHDVLEVQAV
jgi:hypothetical protein